MSLLNSPGGTTTPPTALGGPPAHSAGSEVKPLQAPRRRAGVSSGEKTAGRLTGEPPRRGHFSVSPSVLREFREGQRCAPETRDEAFAGTSGGVRRERDLSSKLEAQPERHGVTGEVLAGEREHVRRRHEEPPEVSTSGSELTRGPLSDSRQKPCEGALARVANVITYSSAAGSARERRRR